MSAAGTPAPLTVRRATSTDRLVLERLWALFRHDLSSVTGELPDSSGRFRQERLDRALEDDAGWAAFLVLRGPSPVGLVVVRGLDADERVLNSFFVVAAARRHGHGLAAALAVVRAHPGPWAVAFQDANAAARAFWPRVASACSGDTWTLEHLPVPGPPDLAPDSWIRSISRSAG